MPSKNRLTKYEKETIIRTSEGDDTYDIYTFNSSLKRRLADFSKKYPQCCTLTETTKEGSVAYTMEKSRLSIRFLPPPSDEARAAMSERAKIYGFQPKDDGKDCA